MSILCLVFNLIAIEASMLTALFVCFSLFIRVSPSEPVDQGCDGDEEQHTEESLLDDAETHSQKDSQVRLRRFFLCSGDRKTIVAPHPR